MGFDIRTTAAKYYDANPLAPDDVPFYRARIPGRDSSVLELGCGTGRVLLPLSDSCRFVCGIDASESMLSVCRAKLLCAGLAPHKVEVQTGDICRFSLNRKFDLIIAPFRVIQNLETDAQLDGLFDCVRTHLAPSGRCILSAFRPNRDQQAMRTEWCTEHEALQWQTDFGPGRLVCQDRRRRMVADRQLLFPELIYRYYEADRLVDEAVLSIGMRYWYPDEFRELVRSHGFEIAEQWGGYKGEPYGAGPEMVLEFAEAS